MFIRSNCSFTCSNCTFTCEMFFPCSSIVFYCFLKAFSKEEYANLHCSITLPLLGGIISSPVRYSYLLNFPDDNADIFAASLLMLYCNLSSIVLPSMVTINFYTPSKRFFLKRQELSDARVVSITKKEYVFAVLFL